MFREKLHFFLATGLLTFSVLAACDSLLSVAAALHVPFAHTSTSPSSLEQVDWRNFTYTFSCYSDHPIAIRIRNGSAASNYVHYYVRNPVFGDLTGDGQPEAVIPFQCTAADAAPAQVFVYSGTAQHPYLLATLPAAGRPWFNVQQASITNGALQLSGYGYKLQDSLCCPSLWTTTSYRWNGSSFVVIATHSSPLAMPTPR